MVEERGAQQQEQVKEQKPNVVDSALGEFETFRNRYVEEQKETLQNEVISHAQGKLKQFRELKGKIDAALDEADEKLQIARNLVDESILSEQQPNGLLTGDRLAYLKCLQV